MINVRMVAARLMAAWVAVLLLIAGSQAANAQSLDLTMAFSPDEIIVGNGSTLTYTIENASLSPAMDATFTNALPTGLEIQSLQSVSGCGAPIVSAPNGGNTISFSEGSISPSSSLCIIQVSVLATTTGPKTNVTSDITSSFGTNSGTSDTLTVNAVDSGPVFSHSFSPSTVPLGGASTITYTIDNTANSVLVQIFDFNEVLPSGIQIDASGLATTTCAATVSVDAGVNTISLSNSLLFPVARCEVVVPVVGQSLGSINYTSAGINYQPLGSFVPTPTGPSFASLTVTGTSAGAPLLVKQFTNDPVDQGGTVDVLYTLTNTNRNFSATNLAFSDDLNAALAGLTFTSLNSTDCSGTVNGVGTGVLSLTGGALAANGGFCTISATLSVPAMGGGAFPGPTGQPTADIDGAPVSGASASDTLIVNADTPPTLSASFTNTQPGGTTTYSLVVTNPSSTQTLTDITLNQPFASTLPILNVSALPAPGACGTGSAFGGTTDNVGITSLSISNASLAPGADCTISWTLNVSGGAQNGTYPFSAGPVTGTLGSTPVQSNAAPASLTVGGQLNVNFTKGFAGQARPGETVDLVFDLSVPAESAVSATNISFTDDLNAMLAGTTANTGGATNTCGGSLSGSATISASGITLAPGGSCQITVPVTISAAAPAGTYTNTTSPLSATPTGGSAETLGVAVANLTVTSVTGTASFTPASVIPGEATQLSIQFSNDGSSVASITFFSVNFAPMGGGITGVEASDTCGGSYTGTSLGIYLGGIIPAGSSCTLTLDVAIPVGTAEGQASPDFSTIVLGAETIAPLVALLNIESTGIELNKSFGAAVAEAGSTASMTIQVENLSATQALTQVSFSDNLDAFIAGAKLSSVDTNTCGATVSGVGTGVLSVSDGSAVAGGTCQVGVSIAIPAGAAGVFENITSDVSGTVSGLNVIGGAARADLTVVSASLPTFTKSFSPSSAAPSDTVTVNYLINNPASGAAVSDMQFSDAIGTAIPGATIVVGSGANACGSGSTVTGGSTLTLAGGNLAPGTSCSFSATFTVPTLSAASFPSTTSALISNGLTLADAASDTFTINSVPPSFSQAVSPLSIAQGGITRLTLTIDNSVNADAVTGVGFTMPFPAGVSVAAVPGASNTCGGMGNASAGSTSLTYAGGSVAAGASCSVQLNLTSATAGGAMFAPVALTSSFGAAVATGTNLTVTAAPLPGFSAAFAPSSIVQGAESVLTYTINNTALIDATGLGFSTTLPTGLLVAPTPAASSTCTGAGLTAVAGTSSFVLSGGTVSTGTSCTVQFRVISSASGSPSVSSTTLASSLGNSAAASATLTITPAPAPTFTAAFAPASFVQGASSTLTFTVNNSASLVPATAMTFSANLPADVTIASPANASSTCTTATVTALAGGNSLSLAGASVAAGASCTVQVDVTSDDVLSDTLTSGALNSSQGSSGTATAAIAVTAAPAPVFTAAFVPGSFVQGDTTTLTFNIDNAAALIPATGLNFSNTLPANVVIAATPAASSTCTGGTVTAVAGAGDFSYAGGSIANGAACTVQVDVTSASVLSATNTSGALNSSQGSSGTATAAIAVTAAPVPTFDVSVSPGTVVQGDVTTVRTEITNSALVPADTLSVFIPFPTGVAPAVPFNLASTCTGGAAADGAGGQTLTASTLAAQSSCFISFDVTASAAGSALFSTGDLTSSLGNSGTDVANLTVTAADLPVFTASFTPNTILQGEVTTLSLMIDNSANLVPAEAGSFTTPFPAGFELADNPNPMAGCTTGLAIGVPSFSADGSSGMVSDLEVEAGATCTYSVDVTTTQVGTGVFQSSELITTLGNSGTAAALVTVNLAPAPEITASYSPDTIVQGAGSTLTFVIDNAAALTEVTNLAFTQTLPTSVVVANVPNAATTCTGGTVTAVAGDSTMSLSSGSVAATGSCTVTVDVIASDAGVATATSSVLSSSQADSAVGATASLTVTGAPAPSFAAAYAPDSIVQGGESILTYTVSNAAALVQATDLAFSETLPAGVTIAANPNGTTSCGSGTLTAVAGSGTLSFAGGQIAAGADCSVSVSVTSQTVGDVTGTSGALTSSLGDSGTTTANLSVTAAEGPTFVKSFSPDTIVQGEVSTLTFTIDNATALVTSADITFSDPFPSGMSVAAEPNVASTCADGTVSADAGVATVTLAGATLLAGESCTVSVDVVLTEAGTATNVTGDLTSSLGNSGTATAQLTATAATAPAFGKVFSPASIAQGEVSRLVFSIDNTAAAVPANDLAFTDAFPAGLTVANTPGVTNTCGTATVTATAGESDVSMSAGTLAAGATCEIGVNVTATAVGGYANTSGDLTSSLGNSGAASATLSVTASDAPGFNSRFSPPSILQGGTTRLILTVDNSGSGVPASGLGFDVTLPSGVFVDGSTAGFAPNARPDLQNTCGGTAVGAANATTVSLTNGTVADGSTCTVSVNVTSEIAGTVGPVTGNLRSSLGGATLVADGSGPLVVDVNPEGRLTIVQNASEDGTFTFSSTAAALNFSITTSGGTGSAGPIAVTQGSYVIQQVRPQGVGNTALRCSDDDSVGDPFNGTLTLNLGPNESVVCTFSSISTQQKTTEVINSFLNRRNNLILSNGPSRARRLDRLRQGVGGSETLSYQNGDLKSFAPANFNLLSAGSGNYSISTSLYQVERSALMFALAHDGIEGNTAIFNPRRFDIWFEAHYNEFKASQGSSGHFGIAYLGADYLITPDVLAGVLLQFDSLDDSSPVSNSSISGQGWMVGPYVTARLAPNLIFDGRLAYGKSVNQVRPFNTYEDEFDTDRFLIDASLSGSFDWDNWVVTPNLSISYIEERQKAYTDSLNVAIPGQKVSLGQIKFGPTFSTTIKGRNHKVIEPSFTVNGIYNFGNRSGPLITNNTADETNGLRARVEAAVRITNRYGTQLELGANYDGIGASDFESWGANFKLTVPLQ